MSSTLESQKENPLGEFTTLFDELSLTLILILSVLIFKPLIGSILTIVSIAILLVLFLYVINKLTKFLIQMNKEKIEGFTFLTFSLFSIILAIIIFLATNTFLLFTKNLYLTPIGVFFVGISAFMMFISTSLVLQFFGENNNNKTFKLSDTGVFSWFLFSYLSSTCLILTFIMDYLFLAGNVSL